MKRHSLIVVVSILLFYITSCGNNSRERTSWDDVDYKCYVNSLDFNVTLPDSISWIISCGDSLPDGMEFFAIDLDRQTLVGIVVLASELSYSHVSDIGPMEYRDIISGLTEQEVVADYGTIKSQLVTSPIGHLRRFQQNVTFIDTVVPDSSTSIVYDGVIGVRLNRAFIIFNTHSVGRPGVLEDIISTISPQRSN